MADIIGTEKDAKDISGANVTIENTKAVTKTRVYAIGADVENADLYSSNLLVCKKDLKSSIDYGWNILNLNYIYNGVEQYHTGITKDYFTSSSGTPFGSITYDYDLFSNFIGNTYNILRAYTTMIPSDPKVPTSMHCSWAVVGIGTTFSRQFANELTVYVNSGTNTFSNMVSRFTITSPSSSYSKIWIRKFAVYASGSSLTVLFNAISNSATSSDIHYNALYKTYFAKMDRQNNSTTVTYTDVTKSCKRYGYDSATDTTGTTTVYPKLGWGDYSFGISNPNKYGIAIAQTTMKVGQVDLSALNVSTNPGCVIRLFNFDKCVASNWVTTPLGFSATLAYSWSNLNLWIDDSTPNGSWILTGDGGFVVSGVSIYTGVIKITNLQCVSNGSISFTNLTTQFASILTGPFTSIAYCPINKVYFIVTNDKLYKVTSDFKTATLLKSGFRTSGSSTLNSWKVQTTPDGKYIILHGCIDFYLLNLDGSVKSYYARTLPTNSDDFYYAYAYGGAFLMPHQVGPGANSNGLEYIDLGLPSGTLWARYNVGSTSETSMGTTYVFSVLSSDDPGARNVYHAVHDNWGGSWQIPSEELWMELKAYTTITATSVNGLQWAKCTSKVNGAYIIIPLQRLSSGSYYSFYPANDVIINGWYVLMQTTTITLVGDAFGSYAYSPVRAVMLPPK